MSQIETIKEMQSKGLGPSAIAQRLQIDRKTARKIMASDSFEQRKPKVAATLPSKLDRYKPMIQSWLEEDRKNRYKQRHTAQRIHNRLVAEVPGYDASYPLVQRYVRSLREARHQEGTLELEWPPGEAQVDFGEADIYDADGEKKSSKFLCVSFPYSNAGYTQLFGGETAECVAHGLRDIFQRIGGVPGRLIFDNASGVGRRVSENVQMAELFLRFKAHYGFEITFCNPYAGHEKGNVENKVGYFRRNLFVPLPSVTDVQAFNEELLRRCEADWQREHYKKGDSIAQLFEDDRQALLYLPRHPFAACRYARVKTDGYGKFSLDGKHFYSASPEWAGREITVRVGAHTIEPLLPSGEPITVHHRHFGKQRTDSVDVRTTLSRLLQNPGAWRNSQLRKALPEKLRDELDGQERAELKETLATMEQLSGRYGFETALTAMEEATRLGRLTSANSVVLAARLSTFEPEESPHVDLRVYDRMLETVGGAGR
ncbi:IS21 family transposase [Paenibacillus cymbidii]|uniref:IS21 family transposase n=1 Tax=Paenibacillus cymbidii TaxID=1639034 RepID=UPI001F32A773|nr:IS21 family transposase [Paenibacillus cymbidii]